MTNVPTVCVDRHKVLQILINLLRNAKYAMEDAEQNTSGAWSSAWHLTAPDRVKIVVSDNGIGIPPENLTKIFNHGFTTKKDGHGFGLHSGAQRRQGNGRQPRRPQRRSRTKVRSSRCCYRPPAPTAIPSHTRTQCMNATNTLNAPNHRILLVDDNPSIHDDFREILCPGTAGTAAGMKLGGRAVWRGTVDRPSQISFELDSAYPGPGGVWKW